MLNCFYELARVHLFKYFITLAVTLLAVRECPQKWSSCWRIYISYLALWHPKDYSGAHHSSVTCQPFQTWPKWVTLNWVHTPLQRVCPIWGSSHDDKCLETDPETPETILTRTFLCVCNHQSSLHNVYDLLFQDSLRTRGRACEKAVSNDMLLLTDRRGVTLILVALPIFVTLFFLSASSFEITRKELPQVQISLRRWISIRLLLTQNK